MARAGLGTLLKAANVTWRVGMEQLLLCASTPELSTSLTARVVSKTSIKSQILGYF